MENIFKEVIRTSKAILVKKKCEKQMSKTERSDNLERCQ